MGGRGDYEANISAGDEFGRSTQLLDSMLPKKWTPRYEPVERKAPEEIGNGTKESENYWQHSATARVESSFFRVKRKKQN